MSRLCGRHEKNARNKFAAQLYFFKKIILCFLAAHFECINDESVKIVIINHPNDEAVQKDW